MSATTMCRDGNEIEDATGRRRGKEASDEAGEGVGDDGVEEKSGDFIVDDDGGDVAGRGDAEEKGVMANNDEGLGGEETREDWSHCQVTGCPERSQKASWKSESMRLRGEELMCTKNGWGWGSSRVGQR